MVENLCAVEYCRRLKEGEKAVAFMKISFLAEHSMPAIPLPPEILELVYMFCICGCMLITEVRKLYPAAVLHGMEGLTDREIVHGAEITGVRTIVEGELS